MIVARAHGVLRIVRQVDHQAQCGQMATAWGNAGVSRIDHWEDIAAAAAIHDEGWRDVDARPGRGSDGRPEDFPHIDRSRHVQLYRVGIERAIDHSPRAGLLVSMHGAGLHQHRLGLDGPAASSGEHDPAVQAFLDQEETRQDALRTAIGNDLSLGAWAWDAYRLLQTWDALSLYLTWRGLPQGQVGSLPRVPFGPTDEGVTLTLGPLGRNTASCTPFPFAGSEVGLPVCIRQIEDRPYVDDEELAVALATAPEELVEFVICPHPSG